MGAMRVKNVQAGTRFSLNGILNSASGSGLCRFPHSQYTRSRPVWQPQSGSDPYPVYRGRPGGPMCPRGPTHFFSVAKKVNCAARRSAPSPEQS